MGRIFGAIGRFGAADLAAALGLLSILCGGFENFSDDPGVGWHLKTGEWIFLNRAVPTSDPFLHFFPPRPWVSDQWLSDLIIYLLHRAGSWPLLCGALAAIYLLTFFCLLLQTQVREMHAGAACAPALMASAAAVFWAFKVGSVHLILRGVIFTFFFFALVYGRLRRLQLLCSAPQEWKREFNGCLRCLPLVFFLWANMHPAFVLGLLLIIFMCAGEAIDAVRRPGGQVLFDRMGALLLLFILCLAATLLNPYGAGLHLSIFALGRSAFFMQLHTEWQPLDLASVEGRLLSAALLIIFCSSLLIRAARRSWSSFDLLTGVFFAGEALRTVRIAPFCAIVLALPLARTITACCRAQVIRRIEALRLSRAVFGRLESREERISRSCRTVFVGAAIVVVWPLIDVLLGPGAARGYMPDPQKYPYHALEILGAAPALKDGRPIVIAATPNWGGFITLFGHGRLKALIDDRNTLIGEDFYRRFLGGLRGEGDWAEYFKSLGADYLLLPRAGGLARRIKDSEKEKVKVISADEIYLLASLN